MRESPRTYNLLVFCAAFSFLFLFNNLFSICLRSWWLSFTISSGFHQASSYHWARHGQAITYTCEDCVTCACYVTCTCTHFSFITCTCTHLPCRFVGYFWVLGFRVLGFSGFRGGVMMTFVVLEHIGCRSQDTPRLRMLRHLYMHTLFLPPLYMHTPF